MVPHDMTDTSEAARIPAYRERKRLEDQMMTCWVELRENAEHAVIAALECTDGLGHASTSRSLPRPTENAIQTSFTVTTSPAGSKHAVTVSGHVACRIDGPSVRTTRGPLTVEVTNLATHPLKTKHESYRKPGGNDDDTSYTIDAPGFQAIIQRLIQAVAV